MPLETERHFGSNASWHRRTGAAVLLLIFFGVAGYASRRWGVYLPLPIRKRTGDALWASVVFCLIALLLPRWSTIKVATLTLIVAYSIEFSQLYHRPWIDHLRSYRIGALVLGSTFFWLDQVAYTGGVIVAATAYWFTVLLSVGNRFAGEPVRRAPLQVDR